MVKSIRVVGSIRNRCNFLLLCLHNLIDKWIFLRFKVFILFRSLCLKRFLLIRIGSRFISFFPSNFLELRASSLRFIIPFNILKRFLVLGMSLKSVHSFVILIQLIRELLSVGVLRVHGSDGHRLMQLGNLHSFKLTNNLALGVGSVRWHGHTFGNRFHFWWLTRRHNQVLLWLGPLLILFRWLHELIIQICVYHSLWHWLIIGKFCIRCVSFGFLIVRYLTEGWVIYHYLILVIALVTLLVGNHEDWFGTKVSLSKIIIFLNFHGFVLYNCAKLRSPCRRDRTLVRTVFDCRQGMTIC